MVEVKTKKIHYRRAQFSKDAPRGHTFEKSIEGAFIKRKTIKTRRVSLADGHVIDCMRFSPRTHGHFIHLAIYTPGESASIVPVLSDAASADTGVATPPKDHDFMDGDLMLLVSGNDVLVCSSATHDAKISAYFTALFSQVNLEEYEQSFSLQYVADAQKLDLVQKEGVKEIVLSATAYEASIEQTKRESARQKLTGAVLDELLALFQKDAKLKDLTERENISAEVVLKFDRRRKGGEVGAQRLARLAQEVLDESSEGFTIRTLNGNTISGGSLTLSKKAKIPAHGKSTQWSPTAKALDDYYIELRKNGHLEK
jgi:hypothetical protein